jgi:predicted thioredoxin/glutaredoxin
MHKVELIYFQGCPNAERAREALRNAGRTDFLEINQSEIEEKSPYKKYSSPSILVDGKLVAGSPASAGACSVIDWEDLEDKLADRISRKR